MPTYDYICRACEHAFELFQQMSDPVKKKCPECGKLRLNRLIGSGAGVIFKGGGFYETDYRSDSYKKSASAEKKAKDDKKGDAKGDTKKSSDSSESKTTAATSEGTKKKPTSKKTK
jgi:putative FmdB family regulatory protein